MQYLVPQPTTPSILVVGECQNGGLDGSSERRAEGQARVTQPMHLHVVVVLVVMMVVVVVR